MSDDTDDRIARIRLARSPHVGPISYRMLLARFGTAEAALAALPDLAARGGRGYRAAPPTAIEDELAAAARVGARHVLIGEGGYPALLAETDTAPPVVLMRGDAALTARPVVAMVGARNASAAACRYARSLAAELVEHGIAVVSGLARGIDGAAHWGSLGDGDSRPGAAIGVVAGGIDIAYPPDHALLQQRIGDEGLLIAELPPGTEPRARDFPRRNRIIAGLALGTIVVEAAPRSGSLITARLAAEAGREVMAVPGMPLDPRSRGCNALIRDGATLIQDARDVMEAIRHDGPVRPGVGRVREDDVALVFADPGDDERARIESLLSMSFVAVDELVRQSGIALPQVQSVLVEMELTGLIERGAGARVRRVA